MFLPLYVWVLISEILALLMFAFSTREDLAVASALIAFSISDFGAFLLFSTVSAPEIAWLNTLYDALV